VRGYKLAEAMVTCGYVFPPREVLFAVRECTDHKPKRVRSGAEIVRGGAVTFPPLELQAANFKPSDRIAVLLRNRSGGEVIQRIAAAEKIAGRNFQLPVGKAPREHSLAAILIRLPVKAIRH
jgi:hypothetical protein